MLAFIQAHQMGVINGVAWIAALGLHYWLGITDKVAAASFVELVINGFLSLKQNGLPFKKQPALVDLVPVEKPKEGK